VPIVSVKVAKADANGRPEPLGQTAYDAFELYLQRKKPAGVRTEVISMPADRILPTMEVTYDALGDPAVLREALHEAMTQYLYSLPFDGEVFFERLRDAAQAVEGVVEVNILSCTVTANNGLQTVDLKAQRRLRLPAGYIDWAQAWDNDYASSNSQYLNLIPDSQ
jgi:tryptophanase